jgi:phenylalanyl-tRNA synthetase alpha chain
VASGARPAAGGAAAEGGVQARVQQVRERFDVDVRSANDPPALAAVRLRYLGRKEGLLTLLLKELRDLPPAERAAAGQAVNDLKRHIEAGLETAATAAGRAAAPGPSLSPLERSLPGRLVRPGTSHPLTQVRQRIEEAFLEMGFLLADGPEVETDYYNFEALNIPAHHPARDAQDTFFVEGGKLLRTHTSPVQIRTMERMRPPVKMVAIGKVFRRDPFDATHSPVFHQVEGLVVAEGIAFAHLKGTLERFCRKVLGPSIGIRLRPSYFPFVEPGAEYDISCIFCSGSGCGRCKGSGWIEMGGCGMVHPAVFERVGIDPERYTGFAFGLGIERIAMLTLGVDDIRLFFENDLRFLRQFPA